MSSNHELAAYAAIRCMRSTDDDVVKQCLTDIIADTYAAPMAEREELRRNLETAREELTYWMHKAGAYYKPIHTRQSLPEPPNDGSVTKSA